MAWRRWACLKYTPGARATNLRVNPIASYSTSILTQPSNWKTLAATAHELKSRLSSAGLKSFLKSTGGKGLHVVVPIRPDHEWPAIKEFAHRMALEMERAQPQLYVTKMTKATRKNRIYLDYLRNDRGSTSIAAYSPRARPGAPVAAPLEWGELDSERAPAFHVADFSKWKTRLSKDPWRKMTGMQQQFPDL